MRLKSFFDTSSCTAVVSLALWVSFGLPLTALANDPLPTTLSDTEQALTTAEEHYNRGVYLFQVAQNQREKGNTNGQHDLLKQSIKNFKSALEQDPQLVEAQSNLGFAYLTLNKHKDAIKAFKKALNLNPQHLNSLNGLGTTYALTNRTEQSLQQFDRLIMLDPGNVQYRFNRASILQKAKRLTEAQSAYQDALKLDPSHQASWFNLATLHENNGQLTEALTGYKKAKAIDITSSIGLESVNRIQWIELERSKQASK